MEVFTELWSYNDLTIEPSTQSSSRDFDKTSRPKASNGQWFLCPAGQRPRLAVHPGSLAGPEAWLAGPEARLAGPGAYLAEAWLAEPGWMGLSVHPSVHHPTIRLSVHLLRNV